MRRRLFIHIIFIGFVFALVACQPKLYTKKDPEPKNFELAKDEASHHKNSLEWWYFTGHLEDSAQNKKFGMEYVLFHFSPTKLKSYAMINLALSDPESPAFYYDYEMLPLKKNWSSNYPLNIKLNKKINFNLSGAQGNYKLLADMSNHKVQYSLETSPLKGLTMHDTSAYIHYDSSIIAGYYSYPRLATKGTIILKNEIYQVQGNLWFDRQWNCSEVTNQKMAWDWFSVQFDNNTELMVYRLYNKEDSTIEILGGSFIDADEKTTMLKKADISIEEKEYWFSHLSDKLYPSKWKIKIKNFGLNVEIVPSFQEQELELKFFNFKKFHYWEGMCKAIAYQDSIKINGNAYVEMTNR